MKKLVTVTNKDIINSFANDDNISLLFPLKGFCVGYNEEFDIDEISDFCLVNRILEDKDIDTLEKILKKSKIKGIVFDDLGIIEIIKDMNITKILLLDHLAASTPSINYYLEYVDSVIVSNDLTENEIRNITNNAIKPVVINVFGLKTLMYSRRTLLSNYQTYHNLVKDSNVAAKIEDKYFKVVENSYGTKFYAWPYYNALSLLDLDNVLYFWYDPLFLDINDIIEVVRNNNISNISSSRFFLDQKTVYKVSDLND